MMTKHVVDPMPRKTRSCSAALPVLNSKHGGCPSPYPNGFKSLPQSKHAKQFPRMLDDIVKSAASSIPIMTVR
jgi:hypothetical protein